jgi:protein TonB
MKYSLRNLCCIAGLLAGGILRAAEIEPPVPVRTVAPEYPAEMRANGTSGIVVLNCEIDEKGAVTDTKVAKTTNAAFNEAAMAAVGKWRFRPAQKDGKPVATHISLPIKFTNES